MEETGKIKTGLGETRDISAIPVRWSVHILCRLRARVVARKAKGWKGQNQAGDDGELKMCVWLGSRLLYALVYWVGKAYNPRTTKTKWNCGLLAESLSSR